MLTKTRESRLCNSSRVLLSFQDGMLLCGLTKWQRNNCKGMREIQWAQVTVSKQYREHAFRKPPSTTMDGGWIKGSFDPWQRSLFVPPVSSANTKEKGPLLAGKLARTFEAQEVETGSGRVFSGSGIWPKYGAGFGKTQNILTGFGIWLLRGKRDSPNLSTGCGILLPVCREFGKSSRPKKPLQRQKRINQASAKYQSKGLIYILNLLAFAEISPFNVFLGKKKRNSG